MTMMTITVRTIASDNHKIDIPVLAMASKGIVTFSLDEWIKTVRVRRTLVQMMRDRGFKARPEDDVDASIPLEFDIKDIQAFIRRTMDRRPSQEAHFLTGLGGIFERPKLSGDGVERWAVIFTKHPEGKQVGVSEVRPFLAFLTENEVDGGILIATTQMTPRGRDDFDSHKLHQIQFFSYDQLVINITHHVFVPKYVHIRDPATIKRILESRRLKANKMPQLPREDPIARYFGAKSGDLFVETADIRYVPQIVTKATTLRSVP